MSSAAIRVSIDKKNLTGTVPLTGSKSESNRALIMKALSGSAVEVQNLSEAADTVTLNAIIDAEGQSPVSGRIVDIGPAGTAMRFLTAFYSLQDGEVILTGSKRMQERPIGILVDALRKLGADIAYEGNAGYPPLRISGPMKQASPSVSIKGDISSQYISALLLIAPGLENGLELIIEGELTSKPYVEMTLAMMAQAGIRHEWEGQVIKVPKQAYQQAVIYVEPDWSAASYWYSIAALADEAELFLPGLTAYSLQGDSKITEIMANFGITSQFRDGGVLIKKEPKEFSKELFDFKECPDLAQTVIVCCAALGYDARFTGLETLKIKETDRVNALQVELAKIGVILSEDNGIYTLDCTNRDLSRSVTIGTYDDHRMAMAFAPLALAMKGELIIEDHRVVEKSYPDYWDHLQKIGFDTAIVATV